MFTKQEFSLIKELTFTEFKLKYKNSVLGFLWHLLKPLVMLLTLYIVFKVFIKIDFENYPLFLLLGIILWNFFSECTSLGLRSLVSKGHIVKKIYFRYEILIISSCLSSFFSFLLNFFIFLIIFFFVGSNIGVHMLYVIFPIIELFFLSLGLALILSLLFLKYRDVGHIWDLLLQVGFWMTPIAYPLTIIPEPYLRFYLFNPLVNILSMARGIILKIQFPSLNSVIISLLITISILCFGYIFYKKNYKKMIEYI